METGATHFGDYKPASGQKIKGHAPQPPKQPPIVHDINNEHKVIPALGMLSDQNILTMKRNLIKTTVDIVAVFPNGEEQKNTVHGSKAVMDLFVDLCSQHHLNPAHYTFELQSWETQQSLNYRPNTLIGTLDVQKILLKLKLPEEKKIKWPPPKIPKKTVRLVVNYLKTQKTVVRVNPEVPLENIIPIICEKCEVSQECIVLLRDTFTGEKLELTKSLNDLGIKELYAWSKKKETKISTGCGTSLKEKKGFLGFFRTSKKNKEIVTMDSSGNLCSVIVAPSLSLGNIPGTTESSEIKKRRAPPLPVIPPFSGGGADREEKMPSPMSQSSLQSEVKKKKKRAPLPPTSTLSNRFEEMENKRKSTIGNVQLSHTYNEGTVEEINTFSGSMPECNIDDSKVINLPSVIISLDFQNDGLNSRNKSIGVEKTLAEIDSMLVAKECSVNNASFKNDKSENIKQRADGIMMEAKTENTDMFMVAGVQKAQLALDKSLAVMKNIQNDSKSQSVVTELNGASIQLLQKAENSSDVSFPVPVTIISEVPENYTIAHSNTEEEEKKFPR